jgi:hypothetical protein
MIIFQSLDLLRDEDSERIEDELRCFGRFLLRSLETEREASELDVELADELVPESESDSESELELSEEDLEDLFTMDDQPTQTQEVNYKQPSGFLSSSAVFLLGFSFGSLQCQSFLLL